MKDISDGQVCSAVLDYQQAMKAGGDPAYPYEVLASETGQPEKVCYRAMERAMRRGLIEYGVSLRTGWLTREGLDLVYAHRSALAVSSEQR